MAAVSCCAVSRTVANPPYFGPFIDRGDSLLGRECGLYSQ